MYIKDKQYKTYVETSIFVILQKFDLLKLGGFFHRYFLNSSI